MTLAGADRSGGFNFAIYGVANKQLSATVRAPTAVNVASDANFVVFTENVWHHTALVYNEPSNRMALYIDGVVVGEIGGVSGTIGWFGGTTPRFFLAYSSNNTSGFYRGFISRVRISDIARDEAYIREVYRKAMLYRAA